MRACLARDGLRLGLRRRNSAGRNRLRGSGDEMSGSTVRRGLLLIRSNSESAQGSGAFGGTTRLSVRMAKAGISSGAGVGRDPSGFVPLPSSFEKSQSVGRVMLWPGPGGTRINFTRLCLDAHRPGVTAS
jgi:hypothetical protein